MRLSQLLADLHDVFVSPEALRSGVYLDRDLAAIWGEAMREASETAADMERRLLAATILAADRQRTTRPSAEIIDITEAMLRERANRMNAPAGGGAA